MNAPFLSNAADANVIEPVNPFEVTLNLDCWNGGLPSEPLENLNAVLSVSNSNNLIKVLPNSEGPITEAHFVYPQSLKNTARVQAFRNFLFSKIGDWK